jgi:hypothetical protein
MPLLAYPRGVRSWANGGYTLTASGTFTATAVNATGRVTLAITWSGASYLNVVRVQNGINYPVRGGSPIGSPGSVTFSDPEAPLDTPVVYRAFSPTYPYQILESNSVTLASGGATWLTHPNRADLSTQLWVERNPDRERPIAQGVFPVLGRRRPIVRTDGVRKASTYTLECATETYAAYANMLQILDDGSPLLLRTPAGYPFDLQTWLAVGSMQETMISSKVTEWARRWPLPVIEVDAPSIVDAPVVP